MTEAKPQQRWHIEKGIPLGWIGALIIQAGVIIYGYAILTFTVDDHDRRIVKIEASLENSIRMDNTVDNRITRIEEKLIGQTQILQEIKEILNKGPSLPRELRQ